MRAGTRLLRLAWALAWALATLAASSPSRGEKRLLIYRIDFPDSSGAAISSAAAAGLVAEVSAYYGAMSGGQMTFAPVGAGSLVTETLRLPQPSTSYDNQFVKLLAETRAVAAAAGYGPDVFDFDVVCTGSKPWLVYGAMAYVGAPGVWIGNGNFNVGVLGHELGHNLGLPHASAWYAGDQGLAGPGTMVEFGDPFDSMGVPGGSTSHFNLAFKHQLGWISDADVPMLSTSGTYRIFAHDVASAGGIRGFRWVRNAAQDGWVEFRQSFNNPWVTNGLTLHWIGQPDANTLLLDVTPGTLTMRDAALLVGRTFSDPCTEWHITPIGKANTTPESLDVVVHRGPFPVNHAPSLEITASALSVPVGGRVDFAVAASDPDGDALAYFWEFGDASWGGNRAGVDHAWSRTGAYVVRCEVTDMKGGTASAAVLVRVGSPAVALVRGRVLWRGQPLGGVAVRIGSRSGYSTSDGAYTVANVPAGAHSPTAVLDGFTLYPTGFVNPIAGGQDTAGVDFVALVNGLNAFTLVSTGAVWRYWESALPPEAGWNQPGYDATGWPTGAAKFGYGVGDERTTLTNAASARPVTVYFRREFLAPDASAIDDLAFRLRRDDGVVVYLNGREVYRENLPPGAIGPETPAAADIAGSDESVHHRHWAESAGLVTGTNVLAVELHQATGTGSDLSFDLELVGIAAAPDRLVPALAIEPVADTLWLSWPAGYTQWQLQRAPTLQPPGDWSLVPGGGDVSEGMRRVGDPALAPSTFYRLRRIDPCDWTGNH